MSKKIIFLLEDDPDIEELVSYLLMADGYEVSSFGRVRTFMDRVEEGSPDLFILDVTLPDGNGLEVSRELASGKLDKPIPILLMSANVQNRDKAIESGAKAFVSKPFDIDDLMSTVRSLLAA